MRDKKNLGWMVGEVYAPGRSSTLAWRLAPLSATAVCYGNTPSSSSEWCSSAGSR